MNKIRLVVLPVVLVLFGASAFAQNSPSDDDNSAAPPRLMQGRGGPIGRYPNAMSKEKIEKFIQSLLELGLIYEMLEKPTIVSTEDGVIVAYGNTLKKYDKDLNVVKEVDLDVNVDGMQDLASKFAKKYSADFMDLMGPMAGSPSAGSMNSSTSSTAAPDANKADDQKEDDIKKEIDQMQ